MKIENEFKSVLNNHPASLYFVACSGGVDSMVLLHLAQQLNFPIHVLHVNYNLRGKDSLGDALFIDEYCEINKIRSTILSVELGVQLNEKGGNLQNEARKIRYDFFQQKLYEVPNSKLLTGQHLNDQIETFWLQLYRGSGLKGMAGMAVERENIIRPFLSIKKSDLIEYAMQNKLSWREDVSNAKSDYQRNKWRNEYLPKLRKSIPNIDESVSLLQQIFEQNLIEIELEIEKKVKTLNTNPFIEEKELVHLQMTELAEFFRKLNIPLRMLIPFVKLYKSQKGAKIEWLNEVNEKQEIIRETNGFYFKLSLESFEIPKLHIELVNELPSVFNKTSFYFNPEKIKGEISIRRWQKGDRIFPLGMNGSKLISDVLTDEKIANWKRENQLVICDEEKILACVGFCIDRRAVSKNEIPALKISLKK